MKPYIHAKNSARKFGGSYLDYLPIHNEMDSSKAAMPDVRHRSIYHSAFGIYIIEKIFGEVITNSDGKKVSVRDIAEQHVIEDLGFIPTLQDYLVNMQIQDWMIRPAVREKYEKEKEEKTFSPEDFVESMEEFNKELDRINSEIDDQPIYGDFDIVLDSNMTAPEENALYDKFMDRTLEKKSIEELKEQTSHIMIRGAEILEKWREEGKSTISKPDFERTKKIAEEIKKERRKRRKNMGIKD